MQQKQTRVQTIDGYGRPVQQPQQQTAIVRRDSFVPPAPRAAPVVEILPPAPLEGFNVQSPAQSMVELRTSYTDRSKGFVWAITPVAAVTGLLAVVAGVALFSVPVLSWSVLQVFLGFFCATWIAGYALHTLVSPDGALFLNTLMLWRTVQREQKHRHDRYWHERRDGGRQ